MEVLDCLNSVEFYVNIKQAVLSLSWLYFLLFYKHDEKLLGFFKPIEN